MRIPPAAPVIAALARSCTTGVAWAQSALELPPSRLKARVEQRFGIVKTIASWK